MGGAGAIRRQWRVQLANVAAERLGTVSRTPLNTVKEYILPYYPVLNLGLGAGKGVRNTVLIVIREQV